MTVEETKEYHLLADKRDSGKMTKKEHKRWKQLINKSFLENTPNLVKSWTDDFGLNTKKERFI